MYSGQSGGKLKLGQITLSGQTSGLYTLGVDYSINAGATIFTKGYLQCDQIYDYSVNTYTLRWAASGGGYIGYASSSIRRKENIQDAGLDCIAKVNALRPRKFTWKSSGKQDYGLIAEEVYKVCPELVITEKINGKDIPCAVDYEGGLPKLLLPYVQDLNRRLSALEERYGAVST